MTKASPRVDLQGLWKIIMFQRLQQLVNITLSEQAAPLMAAYLKADVSLDLSGHGRADLLATARRNPGSGEALDVSLDLRFGHGHSRLGGVYVGRVHLFGLGELFRIPTEGANE
jgi:hypothetical protein